MASRKGSGRGRSQQKQKSYHERKRRGGGSGGCSPGDSIGRVKFVCPTAGDKAAYRSYPVAERELLRIQEQPLNHGKRQPCRVYHCEDCGFYHLTSLEQWDPEREVG